MYGKMEKEHSARGTAYGPAENKTRKEIIMSLTKEIMAYIDENRQETYELLLTMAKIPSPSNHEEKRAQFCKKWLEDQGAEGVFIDDALNVIYPVGCEAGKPVIVFMAHTDVVFPDTEELPLKVEDGKILCPGIGDDTANLAALLMVAKFITKNHIQPKDAGILFVANSGEEGLGNLKGSRKICETYGDRIKEFYSFDGTITHITNRAVGSKRYRVEVLTEGGHSYGAFGNRNAIAYLSAMINDFYCMKAPDKGKTTYNVGKISGGTSVNTIAQQAEMLYEFRSDEAEDLAFMERHFKAVIEAYRAKGVQVNVELLGERPCMGDVDKEKHEALLQKSREIVFNYSGIDPVFSSGSTDCNIPLSLGIPSVCLGTYIGGLAHTREEWVQIDSLYMGYLIAFDLILGYFKI